MSFEYREEGRGRQLRRDHSKFIHEVIDALKNTDISMEDIFGDDRWDLVESTMSKKTWNDLCNSTGCPEMADDDPEEGQYDGLKPVIFQLVSLGTDPHTPRELMLSLMEGVAPTLKAQL